MSPKWWFLVFSGGAKIDFGGSYLELPTTISGPCFTIICIMYQALYWQTSRASSTFWLLVISHISRFRQSRKWSQNGDFLVFSGRKNNTPLSTVRTFISVPTVQKMIPKWWFFGLFWGHQNWLWGVISRSSLNHFRLLFHHNLHYVTGFLLQYQLA